MNRLRRIVKQSEHPASLPASDEPEKPVGTAAETERHVDAPSMPDQPAATAEQTAEGSPSMEAVDITDAPGENPASEMTPLAEAPDSADAEDALAATATPEAAETAGLVYDADISSADGTASVPDEVSTHEEPVAADAVDVDVMDTADTAAAPDTEKAYAADGAYVADAIAEMEEPGDADLSPAVGVETADTGVTAADMTDETAVGETVVSDDLPILEGIDNTSGPLLAADASTGDPPTGVLSPDQVEDQTSPLTPVEREELTALPINAVVDGRFIVQSLLHHGQDRNLYRVTTRKQQRCETCGRVLPSDLDVCPRCGSALTEQPPADFYLMAESYRPDALMQDPGMMDSNLYHPNLVPVIDFFSHKPFGHVRYYAVAEPRQGVRLSQLSLPRPGGQVLNWAMQLSDALDYLHSRGVVGAGAEADDILVQGDRASLASLQNARANVENADELTQQQSMDLARLAGTMFEAFTGQPAAMTPEGVLPMPSSAPEQVGAAFRAAVEPAQGTAPPISAARWRDLLASALEAVAELERPGRPVSFVSAGLTDVGRLRDQNQDSFGMTEFTQASVERPMRVGLYIVADGLGGHKGGEIASAIAVQSFCGEVMSRIISSLVAASGDRTLPGNDAILQGMARAVQAANERIYKARDNQKNDMGTTVVAALIAGGKAYIVNVGDSRIYLYSRPRREAEHKNGNGVSPVVKGTSPLAGTTPLKGTNVLDPNVRAPEVDTAPIDRSEYVLTQVSVDHSLVHRLVELGQLDPEEAKIHPHRNFIYRSLGGPPPVEVDTFVRTLLPGDRLLLCSDGLNSMIEDSAIESVLAGTEDTQAAAQGLINLANEAGGHDNITSILIDITGYLPLAEHPLALSNT
jgi:protein phosphatase